MSQVKELSLQSIAQEAKVTRILRETGLDFTIEKMPLSSYRLNNFGEYEQITSPYFGLLNSKTNEIIHAVKSGYRVSQNDEIVRLALDGCKMFPTLSVQWGAPLNGGRRTFIQLKIEGDSHVGNDTVKRFITIMDSNDGSCKLSTGIGNLTMSCKNQFFKFAHRAQSRIAHSYSLDAKIMLLPQMIEQALLDDMRMIELYNEFEGTEISKGLSHSLVNDLVGIDRVSMLAMTPEKIEAISGYQKNQMDKLYDHISKELNDKGMNLWGLHSGVTSWTTHDKHAPKREHGRLESLMIGSNYTANQKSLQFAMVEAGLKW